MKRKVRKSRDKKIVRKKVPSIFKGLVCELCYHFYKVPTKQRYETAKGFVERRCYNNKRDLIHSSSPACALFKLTDIMWCKTHQTIDPSICLNRQEKKLCRGRRNCTIGKALQRYMLELDQKKGAGDEKKKMVRRG